MGHETAMRRGAVVADVETTRLIAARPIDDSMAGN